MFPRLPSNLEIETMTDGPTGEWAWHCTCGTGVYGGRVWAVGHWLRHLYRWARGRCFYCGDPDCVD